MSRARPTVGVLGIQGDIEKHLLALERVGAAGRRVLAPKHLEDLTALILPGGESTTISKGLVRHQLVKPIQEFAEAGGGDPRHMRWGHPARADVPQPSGADSWARRC